MFLIPEELTDATFKFLMSEKAYAITNYNISIQNDNYIAFDTNYGGSGRTGTWYLFFEI